MGSGGMGGTFVLYIGINLYIARTIPRSKCVTL